MPKKLNVLILSGGPSNEREVSLKTGAQIAKALPAKKYAPHLIEITQEGKWLLRGGGKHTPGKNDRALAIHNKQDFGGFDVAFIGMHGEFGEDGKVQALLEMLGIPYTGSGVLASALGMNKRKTIEIVGRYGVLTPKSLSVTGPLKPSELGALTRKVAKAVGFPCVVKPNESGSSIGISIVRKREMLAEAVLAALRECRVVLVEQYVRGKELTCAVMGNSGQTPLVALPPVEIIPEGEFFDYHAKYSSKVTKEICPARISKVETKKIQDLAKKVHEILGCDGLTRSDFILTPKKKFYFLEINTIPGLTEASLSPKEALAHGVSFPDFLDWQIKLALLKKK